MKNAAIFIVLICLFNLSCNEKPNGIETKLSDSGNGIKDSSFFIVLKKFGKVNALNLNADSNSLIFYCKKSFDSSFLIHIRQDRNEIVAAYYIEMPTYNYDLDDTPMDADHPANFEGYAFTLDSTKWDIIKKEARTLLIDTTYKNKGCRDCSTYGLSYNFKSKIDDGSKYQPFYEFLNDLILKNLSQHRSPDINKEK